MIEKLILNELTLKPAGTVADDGAALVGDAEDGDAEVDDGAVDAVVAVELLLLLLHAAISPANPSTAMLTSNRRGRR